ncbi:MAG TPA: hypothetical protein PK022_01630 [Syntrophales bacterium]|nr:hypothetical protein [Syntrophales bacterium]
MAQTAIVDIDNTLWEFSEAFHQALQKFNPHFPPPVLWTRHQIREGYCSEEDFIAAINSIHHQQDNDDYRPYPEAQNFLSSLHKNGFRVILASHRVPTTRQPTERWLARHRLPYDELHLSRDKTVLFPKADVVVDDAPPILEKAVRCGLLGAGLRFPWNAAYAGNGFHLFPNLNDVLDFILKSV